MILEHYAAKPLVWPPREGYTQDGSNAGAFKPSGLWVSVKGDNDWPWWCEAEQFRTACLKAVTIVKLKPDHNVLIIKTKRALVAFNRRYAEPMYSGATLMTIDWSKVAKDYDGLIIAPYQWSCRFDLTWYYGWDCASGCIWNAEAIAAFEAAEEEQCQT